MSLSFKDSLENSTVNTIAPIEEANDAIIMDEPALEPVAVRAYSLRSVMPLADEGWTPITDKEYRFYNDEYGDDGYSTVDELKNIILDSKQFNITQEQNSQYIPFQMPRYYDGFDLKNTKLSIYYLNSNKDAHADIPVDVYYNDDYIRFAWLVSEFATQVSGVLQFEIHADGFNSKNEPYTWKSKSIDKLNVVQSLEDVAIGEIGVSEEELESWYNKIQLQTQQAQQYAFNAQSSANEAARLVDELQDGIADEVATAVDDRVETVVNEKMQNQLVNYYTKAETYDRDVIDGKIDAVKPVGYATEAYVKDKLGNLVNAEGSELTVEEYVRQEVDAVDVSEELGDLGTNEDGTKKTVVQYVEDAIADVDVSEQLKNYAKTEDVYAKSETYSQTEIDDKLSNVNVDLTGYATEKFVTDKTDILSSSIGDNADSIGGINSAITTINQTLESIDKSPRVTYDATYGDVELDDGSTAEYMFTLWKTEGGVREVQDRFQIMGGGGSTSSVILKIAYIDGYTTPLVTTVDEKAIIKYSFSGEDSAGDTNLDGVASWKIGNRIVATQEVSTGECEFDLSEYVVVGDNKVLLTITHATGAVATKAWTIKVVDVRLESAFDDAKKYVANEPVVFAFTPYGGVNKTVHFLLDGEEIGTKSSSAAAAGLSDSFSVPAQSHGTHLFEIYMTADINGKTISSNHIIKDIIWYDESSVVPVIGCAKQEFTVRQYEAININYTVYDPSTETPSISLRSTYVDSDGEIVEEYNSNITMSSNTDTWQYKTDVIGKHTLTITCGEVVKTLVATVVELGINIAPITTGLVFDFNPVGYSNNNVDRLWSNGDIVMTVSDNFDWVNGGYQYDENGDQCFCIKAGTSAEINYELFGDDAKSNGKQAKLIFKTANVSNGEAVFLSCISDTIGTDKIGLEMKAHEATIYAKTDRLPLPYAEEEVVEFEFNITPSSESPSMVMGYEDGVSTRPLVYDDTHDFQQYQGYRKTISLGSDECDLYIYRFKVYNKSLSDKDILNNFIADARSAEEMIARYDRNQIYKEGVLDPDYLAEVCPQLRIIKLEVPWFTNDKDDKVYDKNRQSIVECIYKGGDPIYDNWVAYDIVHSGQGTSSNNYGAAGRNLDLILKSYKDYGNEPYIILGDGSRVNKVSLTRESIPVNYFNVKVNIASSENANNALFQKRYNQYNPYNRPFVREDASIIPYIKDTMEFQNCVVFVKESDPDLTTHREFNDNNYHLYAIGNIGDSKKTDDTRLTDPSDPYECILEVMDNTYPNSTMPTGKVDEDGVPIYPIAPSEWTVGNSAYDSLYSDKFDESKAEDKENGLADTYGWRYIYEDGTDEQNAEAKAYVEQKWKDFYEFVVTSTDEEFKEHLGDWCVLNSVMYYYLFTLRYTMTDNHAKNSFWHYGKTNDLDSDGNQIRKWDLCFDYDNDTALGIDNYGRMSYRYGYEEIDYVDGTQDWVWNAPNHVFFLRLRKLFDKELCDLYTTLESTGCWSATSLINQFNDWQMQFPEELWRLDIQRKYIRTYTESFIGGEAKPEFLKERANGRKKTQRSQFERNQEKYMSSKFGGTVASADDIVLRCSVPNTTLAIKPNFDITLTAYGHIYVSVKYNTDVRPYKYRLKPNETYTFKYNAELADIIEIYSASCLKDIGDLSACYLINGDFSNAKKIRELVLGNGTEGYNNTNIMTLGLGSNELLNKLDVQNMSGLTHSLDLSGLKNLEELYAFGSGTSGVIFADGGNIRIAEIPDVGTLQMKNLNYLDDEGFESTSTYSLSRLVAEHSKLDLIDLINNSPNLRQVRLIGINWTLSNTDLLERLYGLAGITNTGANSDKSVLAGTVSVPTIGQYDLYRYQETWPDLIVVPRDGIIPQYKVTFKNYDGTELDVQYIDQYGSAIDPTNKEYENYIDIPTKESTVQYSYTFSGWDIAFENIVEDTVVTAMYEEELRDYTIKYVSMGTTLKTATGKYGDNIVYDGEIPTYTAAEPTTFYLFERWDKSGFLTGDFDEHGVKTVNAKFSDFRGNSTFFNGKELKDLSPVQIYAMNKLGLAESVITDKDPYTIVVGNDVDYDDVRDELLISNKTYFDGNTHIDTGIKLFDEDKDFVFAIDYEFLSGTESGSVLVQCIDTFTSNGFELSYSGSNSQITWGTSNDTITGVDKREILVIRHKKGDNNLYIYKSNLDGDNVLSNTLTRTKITFADSTLVFGASVPEVGYYENHAIGNIHWAKIWYADLGDDVCKSLAMWTHESITLEACGFNRYYLSDGSRKRCSFSLLASHLLGRTKKWNPSNYSSNGDGNGNAGGWACSELNKSLNTRLYNAMPTQIKLLIKQVIVPSTIGQQSESISESNCYIAIPALVEINKTYVSTAPYASEVTAVSGEKKTISYMGNNDARKRAFDGGDYGAYWTRSPNAGYPNYVWSVDVGGAVQGIIPQPATNLGVLIMISF